VVRISSTRSTVAEASEHLWMRSVRLTEERTVLEGKKRPRSKLRVLEV
jgi:hypothetical protein